MTLKAISQSFAFLRQLLRFIFSFFRLVSFNLSHRSAARTGGLSEGDSDLDFSQGRSRKGRRSRTTPKVKGYDRDDVYNDISVEDSSATKVSTGFTTDEENSNQSAEIIAETKYRLKSLEKEAQVCIQLVCNLLAKQKFSFLWMQGLTMFLHFSGHF